MMHWKSPPSAEHCFSILASMIMSPLFHYRTIRIIHYKSINQRELTVNFDASLTLKQATMLVIKLALSAKLSTPIILLALLYLRDCYSLVFASEVILICKWFVSDEFGIVNRLDTHNNPKLMTQSKYSYLAFWPHRKSRVYALCRDWFVLQVLATKLSARWRRIMYRGGI